VARDFGMGNGIALRSGLDIPTLGRKQRVSQVMYEIYIVNLSAHGAANNAGQVMREINTNKERIVASHATEAMLIIITARS